MLIFGCSEGEQKMFGMFKKTNNNAKESDETFGSKITKVVLSVFNILSQTEFDTTDLSVVTQMTEESLSAISEENLLKCRNNVIVLFVLMAVAKSANDDGDMEMANTLTVKSKELSSDIMKIPNHEYNDMEFTLIDYSIKAMKEIDLSGNRSANRNAKLDSVETLDDLRVFIEQNKPSVVHDFLITKQNFDRLAKEKGRDFMVVLENASSNGNVACQVILTDFYINIASRIDFNDIDQMRHPLEQAVKFGRMAAESGYTNHIINLPISLRKLAVLITKENDHFSDESIVLIKEAYQWLIKAANSTKLNDEQRDTSASQAEKMIENYPEIIDFRE
jgi:hypothetical protein